MQRELETALDALRAIHATHPAQGDFMPFAPDIGPGNAMRTPHPAETAMLAQSWDDGPLDDLRDAFLGVAPLAQWRLPYAGTLIDPDFMERFGTFCLIGDGGFWGSSEMAGYVVYMPAGLYYPWHQHPAEELYVIVAGEAEFHLEGKTPHVARAGDAVYHPSNQSHATVTAHSPLLAYVTWRNHFETPPVWSDAGLHA